MSTMAPPAPAIIKSRALSTANAELIDKVAHLLPMHETKGAVADIVLSDGAKLSGHFRHHAGRWGFTPDKQFDQATPASLEDVQIKSIISRKVEPKGCKGIAQHTDVVLIENLQSNDPSEVIANAKGRFINLSVKDGGKGDAVNFLCYVNPNGQVHLASNGGVLKNVGELAGETKGGLLAGKPRPLYRMGNLQVTIESITTVDSQAAVDRVEGAKSFVSLFIKKYIPSIEDRIAASFNIGREVAVEVKSPSGDTKLTGRYHGLHELGVTLSGSGKKSVIIANDVIVGGEPHTEFQAIEVSAIQSIRSNDGKFAPNEAGRYVYELDLFHKVGQDREPSTRLNPTHNLFAAGKI